MNLIFDERPSDSPFVERIWRAHSEERVPFLSVAASHWEMVVSYYQGQTTFTVRGPETKVTPHECPPGGVWIGIRFKLGTLMPHLPASQLVNDDVNLPGATSQSFWLQGSAWQFPDFENADTFVDWLVRDGLLAREPVIEAALQNHTKNVSPRTLQRYFLRSTGLTYSTIRQIERARYATTRLQQGIPIADVVAEAGYYDQPHLNRSLQQFIGQTPTQIMKQDKQLSFLYKTTPFPGGILPE
jgi:AraC-like DNA-binding protein